jgi:hypothetical protein
MTVMAKYNESFKLNTKDIALIEEALREEVAILAHENFTFVAGSAKANDRKIHALEELLGKLHNQKIWYGQVHHTGVPLG